MSFYLRERGDRRPTRELPHFDSLEQLDEYRAYRAEVEAEARNERFWEEGTAAQQMQYAWEVEQDEALAREWELAREPEPPHGPNTPCGCGPYDRCHYQRLRDAAAAPTHNAAIRAYARAYND